MNKKAIIKQVFLSCYYFNCSILLFLIHANNYVALHAFQINKRNTRRRFLVVRNTDNVLTPHNQQQQYKQRIVSEVLVVPQQNRNERRSRTKLQIHSDSSSNINEYQNQSNDSKNKELNIAIVGSGPSGLLLAHRMLSSSTLPTSTKITVFESRSDPRSSTATLKGRAYALGLGIRGRTAIRAVDEELWQCVKHRGYECERFDLHFGTKVKLRLRDGAERRIVKQRDEYEVTAVTDTLEPSVLIYQTDLCSALVDELENRFVNDGGDDGSKVQLNFGSIVEGVDINSQTIQVRKKQSTEVNDMGPFDLIVGCDGVNSKVRQCMEQIQSPHFQSTMEPIPGKFKIVRLSSMPPSLDPTSIHAIPSSDGSSAFVEPTKNGEACILFSASSRKSTTQNSNDNIDPLFSAETTHDLIASTILQRFPLLQGMDVQSAVEQIASQKLPSSTYAILCNIYHYKSSVAICGDAAHATGGVSGQGVNSALQDSIQLVHSLERAFAAAPTLNYNKTEILSSALLSYSQCQVPEGLALFDIAFGPKGLTSSSPSTTKKPTKKQTILYTLRNIVDTVFGGRFGIGQPTLQTTLTTTLTPFSKYRRDRDAFYVEDFLSTEAWNHTLALLHAKQMQE